MTEYLTPRAALARRDDDLAAADLAAAMTADLPADHPEARNYRRLLEEALASADEARRDLAEAQRRIAVLEHQARTDPVTGLLNRRGFEIALETALARVRRFGEKGVLVAVDLDGFKQVNDTFGHQAGDLVLTTVATCLIRHTRNTDSVARLGGDEFAILLTDADAAGAKQRVKILDRLLNYTSVPWHGDKIPVHASFGAVPYGPKHAPETLLADADAAMYARKRSR